MYLDDIDFDLPSSFIAQMPAVPADHSKLFVFHTNDVEEHKKVFDLPDLLPNNTQIFFNNTKVVKARIYLNGRMVLGKNGKKSVVEQGEVFFLESDDSFSFGAMMYPAKKYPIGTILISPDSKVELKVIGIIEEGRTFFSSVSTKTLLDCYGAMPLPPYIEYDRSKEDDYQTVFASNDGSVAAPTASLHFTEDLLKNLESKGMGFNYVTLHVGLGTFKPLRNPEVESNDLHEEKCYVSLELFSSISDYVSGGQNILAVGTTVCRVLESLPYLWKQMEKNGFDFDLFPKETTSFWNELCSKFVADFVSDVAFDDESLISFSTNIFIYPGFSFRIISSLMTNFHLPQSSLLLLVSAFIGDTQKLLDLYEIAKKRNYRFYSFGDAMLFLNFS